MNVNELIKNIYYLAKEKNIKIGELENNAGVTPGYLSRFLKKDTQSIPNLEVIFSIANQLNVPLESILYEKYTEINNSDLYFVKSINDLTDKTRDRKIIWDVQCPNYIRNLDIKAIRNGYFVDHPLCAVFRKNDRLHVFYWSFFASEKSDKFGNIYLLKKEKAVFYLSYYISEESNKENYELYRVGPVKKPMGENYELTKICNAVQGGSKNILFNSMKVLYEACNNASKTPYINEEIKDAIDELLE